MEIAPKIKEYGTNNCYTDNNLYMNGPEIFNFTIKNIPSLVKQTLAKNNMLVDELSYVIFHQANKFMLEYLRKKIKIPENKFYIEFELSNAFDLENVTIPKRKVINNFCSWKYRGEGCKYQGDPVADSNNVKFKDTINFRGVWKSGNQYITNDSVYLNVAKGFFPVGGGIARTLNNFNPEMRKDLRVLWQTEGYTPHAFAASDKVSVDAVARLQAAMVAMQSDPEGASLLENIGFKGIERAEDKDWDDIRALNLNALDDLVQ